MYELPKLPKPNTQGLANLEKIAAMIGKQLRQIPIEDIMKTYKNGYSCDEAGDVTGLNLRDAKISDISFLIDFTCLTHLNLKLNQIIDLSPLQALIQKIEIKWE